MIHHNHVYNQTTASSGALYPDEGSAYEVWTENVVQDIGSSEWLHLWTSSIHNVTVENNYADTHTYMNHGEKMGGEEGGRRREGVRRDCTCVRCVLLTGRGCFDSDAHIPHAAAGTNCPMINNTIWQHGSPPPAAAQAIIDAAGPIDNPFV